MGKLACATSRQPLGQCQLLPLFRTSPSPAQAPRLFWIAAQLGLSQRKGARELLRAKPNVEGQQWRQQQDACLQLDVAGSFAIRAQFGTASGQGVGMPLRKTPESLNVIFLWPTTPRWYIFSACLGGDSTWLTSRK